MTMISNRSRSWSKHPVNLNNDFDFINILTFLHRYKHVFEETNYYSKSPVCLKVRQLSKFGTCLVSSQEP